MLPVGAALLVVSGLAVATVIRPGTGWFLLLAVTAVTGLVAIFFGEDLRAEHRAATTFGAEETRGRSGDDHIAADRNLRPNAGTLVQFCLATAVLGIVYFFTYIVFIR